MSLLECFNRAYKKIRLLLKRIHGNNLKPQILNAQAFKYAKEVAKEWFNRKGIDKEKEFDRLIEEKYKEIILRSEQIVYVIAPISKEKNKKEDK